MNMKSARLDEITAKMIKRCSKRVLCQLVSVTNLSLAQGHFPFALKQSTVYSKLKSGSHTEVYNYILISRFF